MLNVTLFPTEVQSPEQAPATKGADWCDLRRAHFDAEELRLRMGQDGCGCGLCQDFYASLDLARFGSRVQRFADGLIQIADGSAGADLMPTGKEGWSADGLLYFSAGRGFGIAPSGKTISVGSEAEVLAYLKDGTPPKDISSTAKEVLRRVIEIKNKPQKGDKKNVGTAEPRGNVTVKHVSTKRVKSARAKRARPALRAQFKPTRTRHVKARKTLSVRTA